jgi:CO/xanthine dehydrogenase Mo-binding subunit
MAEKGIGVRLIRKEDDRHLHGRGNFVADIKLAGMKDVAFVRSRVAHARIAAIHIPPMAAGSVFVGDDLKGVKPIRALSKLPGYKVSDYAILTRGKVRFVGELVAMCLGDTRAEAEDLARQVSPDYEDLGAVSNMFEAQKPDAPLLHEHWGNNVVLETFTEGRRPRHDCGSGSDHNRARVPDEPSGDRADGGHRGCRLLGQPHGSAHPVQFHPVSQYRANWPGRVPRPRAAANPRDRA